MSVTHLKAECFKVMSGFGSVLFELGLFSFY